MSIKSGLIYRILLLTLLVSCPLAAEVQFSDLGFGSDNELAFIAEVRAPGFDRYRVAMTADPADRSVTPLTFYPEELSWLPVTGEVQIRNRIGAFRVNPDNGRFSTVESFDSFAAGGEIRTGLLSPMHASPDGRYLAFQRSVSPGHADLVLLDTLSGEEFVVAQRVAATVKRDVVRFAPDGRHFVYERDGDLYLFPLEEFRRGRLLAEHTRFLGSGSIENVRWAGPSELVVIQGRLIHRIESNLFFTRSLYRPIIERSEIVGRLPFSFDSSFDRFWVAPGSGFLLLDRGGRNLLLSEIEHMDRGRSARAGGGTGSSERTSHAIRELPFLALPDGSTVEQVVWSGDHVITVLLHSDNASITKRLTLGDANDLEFERVDLGEDIREFAYSPDGQRLAVVREGAVEILDYRSLEVQRRLEDERYLSARWTDDRRLFVAGDTTLSLVPVDSDERQVLALTQGETVGFSEEYGELFIGSAGTFVRRDGDRFISTGEAPALAGARRETPRYRAFLEPVRARSYRNRILVRDLEQLGTFALFPAPDRDFAPFPSEEGDIDVRNFSHGSRLRRREVAFSINAIGGSEGLSRVLQTLSRYDARATFFVNGDFIRRDPGATRRIAESGHEAGNLFSTYIDLTDATLGVTSRYIREGLAENEDLYYNATDSELSPLWHAPYYVTGGPVIEAGEALGYRHIGRDINSLDAVPQFSVDGLDPLYRPTSELIERIIRRVQPGSIIDITLGIPGEGELVEGRRDYLYHRLDVLMNALTERGYSVVPVSTLIERAQEGAQ